ncbi:hypothetical protein AB835_12955 [Candidatus Endobugula sertula]|uniref:Sulfurtransferase n=1 Tax=Candidatus Endobugula sertula TaxID=62101 RepID=A0A1D2QM58_9GAMM|nr:hypothetical protein AB835_12955 [Candidatus Endobugula sertula]
MSDSDVVLVDTRDSNLFNGWPASGDKVGGHIPRARNFSVRWLNASKESLNALLATKGITADKQIIAYGSDAEQWMDWLVAEKDFSPSSLVILNDGIRGWLKEENTLEVMPGYKDLITPQWLDQKIRSGKRLSIMDVSWGTGIRFVIEHIPGAVHVDTNLLESKPLWNLRSPQGLDKSLLSLGITSDATVVVYGEDMTAAARMVFTLKHAGVEDVKLLNGGLTAWKAADLPIERGSHQPEAAEHFGKTISEGSEILYGTMDVEELLNQPASSQSKQWLVSVRSWPEYIGKTSGYNYIQPKGRIPGAQWGRSGSDPWHMEDYLNPDGTLREAADLVSYWEDFGASTEDTLVFYCGTGWRASLAWFAAELIGVKNAGLYDGGWFEWSSDPKRSVLLGDPANQVSNLNKHLQNNGI